MDLSDIEAVLFDMDGTLVDSDAAVARAWTTWSGEYGANATEVIAAAHGAPADSTIRKLLPELGDDATLAAAARQLELQYEDLADVIALPGAHELIGVLASRYIPWAIVTSADDRLARARLAAAEIVPPILVSVDQVAAGKPDPAGYLRAAALIGVPAENCLVVEDAEVGLEAARAAGARTAALRGLDGDIRLTGLSDLAELFGERR